MSLNQETAHALRDRLEQGEITSKEITNDVIAHINTTNNKFNAFISVDADAALSAAEAIDQRRAKGAPLGPLAGIPLALKDILCTQGSRTTCGSHILHNYIAPYDATVVAKLRQADAIFIGKTNMDEFAMGSSNENSAYGPVLNPHNTEHVPGGSSGGSAAAVAAHQTILSVGTDTGGSIRQPASYCGVVGLKPTYGRVSRYGLVAYASSLDQAGPITKDVEDAALLLNAIAGHDPSDSTSVNHPVPDYSTHLKEDISGLKVGMAKEHFSAGLDTTVQQAIEIAADRLKTQGATLVDLSLPVAAHPDYCVGTYYLIATAEASANLSRYDGIKYGFRAPSQKNNLHELYHETRSQGFGPEVKRRILLGAYALSAGYYDAYYLKAQKVRTLIRRDFDQAFNRCDVILSPVAPTTAFRLGEKIEDPLQMYLNDIYTASTNLAGLPGISVPVATEAQTGLPIGAQLLAAPFAEQRLLNAAYALEQAIANSPLVL